MDTKELYVVYKELLYLQTQRNKGFPLHTGNKFKIDNLLKLF